MGQGFFHTAELEVGRRAIHWVYDCGSIKGADARRDAVHRYRNSRGTDRFPSTVDLLVISHAHSDHTNGLPELFAEGLTPRVVMMPLLDHAERLVALLESAAGLEASDREFAQRFAEDPIDAIGNLGAEAIVLVRAGNDALPPDFEPDANLPASDVPDESPLRRSSIVFDRPGEVLAGRVPGFGGIVYVMSDARELNVISPRCDEVWRFIPQVDEHAWRGDQHTFIERLESIAGRDRGETKAAWVLRLLRRHLRAVQREYKAVFRGSTNATSMSLFAGPAEGLSARVHRDIAPCGEKTGWLATGDAELSDESRRQRFLERYERAGVLRDVGTFAAPHHGSRENWHESLLERLRPETVVVGVGGRGGWTMPCGDLIVGCDSNGVHLQETTADVSTELWETMIVREA